jgi:Skp family chaperone for outer membrane proteins
MAIFILSILMGLSIISSAVTLIISCRAYYGVDRLFSSMEKIQGVHDEVDEIYRKAYKTLIEMQSKRISRLEERVRALEKR